MKKSKHTKSYCDAIKAESEHTERSIRFKLDGIVSEMKVLNEVRNNIRKHCKQ